MVGGHASRRDIHGGACMVGGMCGRGVCMTSGHAWSGGMHGREACMVGGMCDQEEGGVHGQRTMHGRGCVWQERRPLQWVVHILLEWILLV